MKSVCSDECALIANILYQCEATAEFVDNPEVFHTPEWNGKIWKKHSR